ncbi:uncharacterized protein K489DRAFT_408599 [Dissoconium aciculare CBS 342.82]|uniref:Uncharacterized protein n=1 Tax=Dissoconium aciculare CBS 342.82 TaxID=1314786 RepID=A0A6J3M991_9PEZI|nr:uncharacterized protein K489DRAFT_408599 [Dissoconium aciculare CBS 342.82]KAF1824184.1 hypothetical protein K489DRAFT_408599 [Dissoconium aciculare CBS 342.82]
MSFKKTFEKRLNRNMQQDSEVGESSSSKIDDMDIKTQPGPADDADDYDLNMKKDAPPRFSTLFGPAPPIVQSVPTPSPRREYFPPPQRKSGIWMPWSLFIILAVMLFLESTVLFTYTVIGLYNNTPSRLLALAGQGIGGSMPYGMCEPLKATSPQPAAVNFAPNFVMPQAAPASSITVTVTLTTTASATTPTTSTSTTTSTTSASPTTSSKSDAGVLTVTAPVHIVTETQTFGPTTTGTPSLATSTATGTTTTPNSGTVQAGVFLPPIVLGTTSTAKTDATTFLPPIAATTSSA